MTEIATIGYEGLTSREFLKILDRARIRRVIDVRELAMSRRPGFAKTALTASLAKAGIAYTHLPELGTPRKIRHEYRQDRNWQRYSKRFCAYLATRDDALQSLAGLVEAERCCLLCFEKDPNHCHRSFVAESLGRFIKRLRITHLAAPVQN